MSNFYLCHSVFIIYSALNYSMIIYFFILRIFPYFCPDDFKVICCRFVVYNIPPEFMKLVLPFLIFLTGSCLFPFPFTDAFICIYSKKPLENIVAKGDIAHDEQFLDLSQYFHFHSIFILSFIEAFQISVYVFKKLQICCMRERHNIPSYEIFFSASVAAGTTCPR